jgi:hypothetical protein
VLPPEPETFWAEILSGRPERVLRSMAGLSDEERAGVIGHLRRMAQESGWQTGQQANARTALDALDSAGDDQTPDADPRPLRNTE